MACMIWRRARSKTNPRKGRTLRSTNQRARRNRPSASMNAELTTRSALAAPGVLREVGVESCGQVVNGVADSRCRSGPRPDQRLRPEPQRQDDSGHHKPKKQTPPLNRALGFLHEALSTVGNRTKLFAECTLRHLQRQFARFSQIEFSRAKIRKLLNTYELVRPGTPESRQFTPSQSF